MGLQENNAGGQKAETVFRCQNEARAKELQTSLSIIFPQLNIGWDQQNFEIYAKQGLNQSIHDYHRDRKQLRRWLASLPDSFENLPKLLYQSALLTLDFMEKQLTRLEPIEVDSFNERMQEYEKLMSQVMRLSNFDALLVICKDINLLVDELNLALEKKR